MNLPPSAGLTDPASIRAPIPALPPLAGDRRAGFTLLEVLVAMAIVAVAIFPLLQLTQESKQYAFDAKFTVIASNTAKLLLSEKMAMAKPGSSEEGTLADLQWDMNDLVADLEYVSIFYEWEVEEVDLSTDLSTSEEDPEATEDDASQGTDEENGGQNAEDEIPEGYRARYAKVTIFYRMDTGFERELVVETFLPPLPNEDESGPIDAMDPNNG